MEQQDIALLKTSLIIILWFLILQSGNMSNKIYEENVINNKNIYLHDYIITNVEDVVRGCGHTMTLTYIVPTLDNFTFSETITECSKTYEKIETGILQSGYINVCCEPIYTIINIVNNIVNNSSRDEFTPNRECPIQDTCIKDKPYPTVFYQKFYNFIIIAFLIIPGGLVIIGFFLSVFLDITGYQPESKGETEQTTDDLLIMEEGIEMNNINT